MSIMPTWNSKHTYQINSTN